MPENNQVKWVGVRPTNPEEIFAVKRLCPDEGQEKQGHGIGNNSTVTLWTVPANKYGYINTLYLSGYNTSGTFSISRLFVTNAADVLQYDIIYRLIPHDSAFDASVTFPMPMKLESGYKLKIRSYAVGNSLQAFVHGYEIQWGPPI